MAEIFNLAESCMALKADGERCTRKGSERIASGIFTYAVCKQHADMWAKGAVVNFATFITPRQVIVPPSTQPTLPGLSRAAEAREALAATHDIEVFFVKSLSKDGNIRRVKVVYEAKVNWGRSVALSDLGELIALAPSMEGVTGILVRQGTHKLAFNAKGSTWQKVNVTALDIRLVR